MKTYPILKPYWIFLVTAFIFSLQVFTSIQSDSLTNDEPAEITNGYYYLTQGDVVTPHLHPPLASALLAAPLLTLHLKTAPYQGDVIDRSHFFIFDWNLEKLSEITLLSRLVNGFFGLLTGFILFLITRQNGFGCAATLFFWATNPTWLGLAGVSKIETIPAFFCLIAIWVFQKSLANNKAFYAVGAGLLTAMAVTSKLYCLTLIPIFIILEWNCFKQAGTAHFFTALKRWAWGFCGFIFLIFIVYLPAFLSAAHPQAVWFSLAEKFAEDFVFADHPYPVYFLGHCTLENHWYYFPVAFLLKEPLSFIFALFLAWGLAFSKKTQIPLWQWIPAVLFCLLVLPATNLGVRYMLPAYPFLFLIAGQSVVWLWKQGGRQRLYHWLLGGLFLGQAISVGLNFPHSLSYFNELVPLHRKLHYLGDSNLDWGQDLKRLADKGRERKWGRVKLAYLGGVDPQVYGLDWEPFQKEDLQKPQPGTVYAVNASFYQLAPVAFPSTLPIVQSWLNKTEPTGKIADSWYYFEIPGKKEKVLDKKWLPSVPFLQYRGYCAYALSRGE